MPQSANPEDAFDRLGEALGLTDAPTPQSGPSAIWNGPDQLIITGPRPEEFAGRTQSFAVQQKPGWRPLTFSQAHALANLRG